MREKRRSKERGGRGEREDRIERNDFERGEEKKQKKKKEERDKEEGKGEGTGNSPCLLACTQNSTCQESSHTLGSPRVTLVP